MNYWHFVRGGDDAFDRLRLYLQHKTNEDISQIKRLSTKILFIESAQDNWLLKPFPTAQALSNQLLLTEKLHEKGFKNTYRFHPIHHIDGIMWDYQIWGLFDYLPPKVNEPFHYGTLENRKEALQLMRCFHTVSAAFVNELPHIKPYHLEQKWRQRLVTFTSQAPNMRLWMGVSSFQQLLQFGTESLAGLAQYLPSEQEEVILHGDLAHHNFFRHQNNSLYLVDFDLMGKGPKIADELQIANRMLPSIMWSYTKLMDQHHFSHLSSSLPFLYGLLFPSDIFREWNRFWYSSMQQQQQLWPYLYEITNNQWTLRMRFYERVKKEIAALEGNN